MSNHAHNWRWGSDVNCESCGINQQDYIEDLEFDIDYFKSTVRALEAKIEALRATIADLKREATPEDCIALYLMDVMTTWAGREMWQYYANACKKYPPVPNHLPPAFHDALMRLVNAQAKDTCEN